MPMDGIIIKGPVGCIAMALDNRRCKSLSPAWSSLYGWFSGHVPPRGRKGGRKGGGGGVLCCAVLCCDQESKTAEVEKIIEGPDGSEGSGA